MDEFYGLSGIGVSQLNNDITSVQDFKQGGTANNAYYITDETGTIPSRTVAEVRTILDEYVKTITAYLEADLTAAQNEKDKIEELIKELTQELINEERDIQIDTKECKNINESSILKISYKRWRRL